MSSTVQKITGTCSILGLEGYTRPMKQNQIDALFCYSTVASQILFHVLATFCMDGLLWEDTCCGNALHEFCQNGRLWTQSCCLLGGRWPTHGIIHRQHIVYTPDKVQEGGQDERKQNNAYKVAIWKMTNTQETYPVNRVYEHAKQNKYRTRSKSSAG